MITVRELVPSDADVVADLHAQSWRATYRGILRDSYLDGALFEERRALWRDRLYNPGARHVGLLALSDDAVVGFVFAFADHDSRWGTLLDNLHVKPDSRDRGAGTQLLADLAETLLCREHGGGIYLWVFEANHRTRRYYERLGAEAVERAVIDAPGGGEVVEWRYAWESAALLRDAVTSRRMP